MILIIAMIMLFVYSLIKLIMEEISAKINKTLGRGAVYRSMQIMYLK